MEKTFVGVRDVDGETFRKFKVMSAKRKLKLSEAFREAVNEWVKKEFKTKKLNPKNLLGIRPIRVGDKKARWSEEVDEIL